MPKVEAMQCERCSHLMPIDRAQNTWVIADGYPELCDACWRRGNSHREYRLIYRRKDGTLGAAGMPAGAADTSLMPADCKRERVEMRMVEEGDWENVLVEEGWRWRCGWWKKATDWKNVRSGKKATDWKNVRSGTTTSSGPCDSWMAIGVETPANE